MKWSLSWVNLKGLFKYFFNTKISFYIFKTCIIVYIYETLYGKIICTKLFKMLPNNYSYSHFWCSVFKINVSYRAWLKFEETNAGWILHAWTTIMRLGNILDNSELYNQLTYFTIKWWRKRKLTHDHYLKISESSIHSK